MNIQKLSIIRFEAFKTQDHEMGAFDVIFDIGGRKLYSNKFMLLSISTTFSSMISDRWTSKDVPIPIETYDYDEFFEFLIFLYSGECQLTNDNIFTMIDIAEFYQVHIFKNYCKEFITKIKFNLKNVIQLFDIASKYSLDDLKKSIVPFIKSNAIKILNCDQILQISKQNLLEILVMRKSDFPVEEGFEKVYEWAESQAKTEKETDANLNFDEMVKEILTDFMPLFDFNKMDHSFVLKYLVRKSLLLADRELALILLNSYKYTVNVKITDANGRIMKGKFCDPGNVYNELQKLRSLSCTNSWAKFFYWEKSCGSRPSQITLEMRDGVEWYLIYDFSNYLAVINRSDIFYNCYLIAEMFPEEGFVMSRVCKIEAFRS